jgi:UDP-N-acetylglucosamine 3-dehydrogenase
MLRVGVIGVGQMGQHHVRNYSAMENVELVGIADLNQVRIVEIAKKFDTQAYVNYKELLEENLDAVSMVVPTSVHIDVALEVIKSNTHLLIEKPIANSLESAREIYEAVKDTSLKLLVGHIERFNPAVSKLKELIDTNILGDLLLVSSRRVGPFVPRIMDVGIITDSASHDIDIIRYLIGAEPKRVFSLWRGLKNKKGDHALIVFDFGNTLASVEVNWFSPNKVRNLTVTGTEGTAELDYIEQRVVVYNSDSKIIPKIEKAEPLRIELEHFVDCIINDKEPLVNAYEGFKVLEIATEAERKYDTSC